MAISRRTNQSNTGQFLWINKTSASPQLSRSYGNEYSTMLRFILRKRRQTTSKRHRISYENVRDVVALETGPRKPQNDLNHEKPFRYGEFRSMKSRWRAGAAKKDVKADDPREPNLEVVGLDKQAVLHDLCSSSYNDIEARFHTKRSDNTNADVSAKNFWVTDTIIELQTLDKTCSTGTRSILCKLADERLSEFFGNFMPLEAPALGLSLRSSQAYISTLADWSTLHDDVFIGLILYDRCCFSQENGEVRCQRSELDTLRSMFLQAMDLRLRQGIIDVVLLQVILIAIAIDERLDYDDFLAAHVEALKRAASLWERSTRQGTWMSSIQSIFSTSILTALVSTSLRFERAAPLYATLCSVNVNCITATSSVPGLPEGFQSLVLKRLLSTKLVNMLMIFGSWELRRTPALAAEFRSQCLTQCSHLTSLELVILTALTSIIDDLTGSGDHVFVLLWKGSRSKVVFGVLNQPDLWERYWLRDILLWLITVLATPKKAELIPFGTQTHFQQRFLKYHPEMDSCWAIDTKLRRFFCPAAKLSLWNYAWQSQVSSSCPLFRCDTQTVSQQCLQN